MARRALAAAAPTDLAEEGIADMARLKIETELDRLGRAAAEILLELGPLDHPPTPHKLKAQSFLNDALAYGECTVGRLREIAKTVEARGPNAAAVARLINRISKFYSEGNTPCPSSETAKIARIFSDPDGFAAAQMADLRLTAGEVCALAALEATEHHAERFGTIESWEEFSAHWDGLHLGLAEVLERMRHAWAMSDVEIDAAITPSERDSGLQRLRFKRFPSLTMIGGGDWPLRFAEHVAAEIAERKAAKQKARETAKTEPTEQQEASELKARYKRRAKAVGPIASGIAEEA
jgi:hypothetical protein